MPAKGKSKFGAMRVKCKSKSGRGTFDAGVVVEAMMEHWKALQSAIEEMGEEKQDELRDHFNDLIDGEPDLGDILFGEPGEFDSRVKFLADDVAKKYTDELIAQEVLDKDELGA